MEATSFRTTALQGYQQGVKESSDIQGDNFEILARAAVVLSVVKLAYWTFSETVQLEPDAAIVHALTTSVISGPLTGIFLAAVNPGSIPDGDEIDRFPSHLITAGVSALVATLDIGRTNYEYANRAGNINLLIVNAGITAFVGMALGHITYCVTAETLRLPRWAGRQFGNWSPIKYVSGVQGAVTAVFMSCVKKMPCCKEKQA